MGSLTRRRWRIFQKNTRAKWALRLFIGIFCLSLAAPFLANDKPLILLYKGHFYFPIFETLMDDQLDGNLPTEAEYKDAYTRWQIYRHGTLIMPPIEYAADTVDYFSTTPFPAPPSSQHWLGTDDQGRDILARLLYGTRLSILFGLALTVCSAFIGIAVGALQGYFGGRIDLIIGRFLEIWNALPQLFILIIISSLISPSFLSLLIVLMLFSWTSLTSVVRAEFLRTRSLDYVKAAKILGVSDIRIMCRHILPNALVSTITYIPFILAGAIVSLSALDVLGLGLPSGTASLGDLIRQGKENLQAPWIGLSIFVFLTFLLALLLFIGEGVRDAFDPHTRPSIRRRQ